MKYSITIFFLFFFSTAKTQIVVSNDVFRNLYLAVDNPISLSVLNVSETLVVVKTDDGVITKTGKAKYTWRICATGKRFVYLKVYNKSKLIDSIPFRILPLPDPEPMACIDPGCQGVRADINDFVFEGIRSDVEKFTVTIEKNSGVVINIENFGPYYSRETNEAFQQLKVGEKVTLSNFVVRVSCETFSRPLKAVLRFVFDGKDRFFRR